MDAFNNVNPFDRDFAIYNAAAPQPQQQQAKFEPYLNEVPQPDTADEDNPACQDAYQPHVSEEKSVGSPSCRVLSTRGPMALIRNTPSSDAKTLLRRIAHRRKL
ncbi:hypothetical protein ACVW16_004829 [Bradyrhizobium sp. USDA 4474]